METKCQIYAVAMVIGYIRHISLCFGNRTGCISVIFHFGQQHGYVTGFDKNRLGRTHQANSFPSPIDRFIHGLTIYGYFTVHSSQSSVCFHVAGFYGLSGAHKCTGAFQMALVLADN